MRDVNAKAHNLSFSRAKKGGSILCLRLTHSKSSVYWTSLKSDHINDYYICNATRKSSRREENTHINDAVWYVACRTVRNGGAITIGKSFQLYERKWNNNATSLWMPKNRAHIFACVKWIISSLDDFSHSPSPVRMLLWAQFFRCSLF